MQSFSDDFRFFVVKTTEEADLRTYRDDQFEVLTADGVALYLKKASGNAVVLMGSDDKHFGRLMYESPIWVARSGNNQSFYAAQYPFESPDDMIVESGDIEEVLRGSTIEYYS